MIGEVVIVGVAVAAVDDGGVEVGCVFVDENN